MLPPKEEKDIKEQSKRDVDVRRDRHAMIRASGVVPHVPKL
jgi:hypothetical protein